MRETIQNAKLSAQLLQLLNQGIALPEAFNTVFGKVMSYDKFVDELYTKLRNS